jgi:glutamate synthase (NADPH/NADH) small chain
MGDPRGFLKLERIKEKERPVEERVKEWREFTLHASEDDVCKQASRCMDCGIPFCHQGCPLGNLIPEWNDLVYRGKLDEAVVRLHETNNFPEVTGRVCPAPCEASCVLNIDNTPVTIKVVERTIADHAIQTGRLEPEVAAHRTGKRVAVVGAGPAGMACGQQLARAGHDVTLYERDDRVGGLLRYGIPDFKLEKGLLDLRVAQMTAEGVRFETGADIGANVVELRERFDALVLTGGARAPRDLPVEGRALGGVHFAMEFLAQQNRRVASDEVPEAGAIWATGKRVVVIGGGDTGSDCVGTSIRHGAKSVLNVELFPKPGLARSASNPWPEWPFVLRTSSSHEEGAERDWAVMTKRFRGDSGRVTHLDGVRVKLEGGKFVELAGTEFSIEVDLVLLAMGFVGPERGGAIEALGVELDGRGNVKTASSGATSVAGVFAAGDIARGQSLVVWAIADGRRVAKGVDSYLSLRGF